MAGEIIRLGDSTSHGGKVIEGSLTDICHGKPIAYVGHKTHCPKCKGDYPIVEGVMTTTFFGKGVAVAGMKTACGATLIPTQFLDTVDWSNGAAQQKYDSDATANGASSFVSSQPSTEALPAQPAKQNVNDLGFRDDQILIGKSQPSEWFESTIDSTAKTISVTFNVKYDFGDLTAMQATKLQSLAEDGISRFWSRQIDLNGETYDVKARVKETADGQPIRIRIHEGPDYRRSFNMNGAFFPLSLGKASVYYQQALASQIQAWGDHDFEVVAAHEIGHPVLMLAGGTKYSWGHEGSSGIFGGENGKRLETPPTGELDIMKYYREQTSEEMFDRAKASESDVKNLVYISTRH